MITKDNAPDDLLRCSTCSSFECFYNNFELKCLPLNNDTTIVVEQSGYGFGFCKEGTEGFLCGKCSKGYYDSGSGCKKCYTLSTSLTLSIQFIFFIVISLFLLISRNYLFLVFVELTRIIFFSYFTIPINYLAEFSFIAFLLLNSSETKRDEKASCLIKIFIFYSQFSSQFLSSNFNFDLPNTSLNFYCNFPDLSFHDLFTLFLKVMIPFYLTLTLLIYIFLQHKLSNFLKRKNFTFKRKKKEKEMIPNFIFTEDSDEMIINRKFNFNKDDENEDLYEDRLDVQQYLENRWRITSKKIFLFIIFLSYYDISRLVFEVLGCSSQNQIKYGNFIIYFFLFFFLIFFFF